jgi:succinate dehydrogenase/fumarate reductase flavoprotein subunit
MRDRDETVNGKNLTSGIAKGGVSRRDFVKTGALATGLLGGAVLVGCSPQASGEKSGDPEEIEGDVGVPASTHGEVPVVTPQTIMDDPFFAPPAPVTDITESYDFDIVVVGAGISGTCAALAATDEGAKVGVLSKTGQALSQGILFSAFNVPAVLAEAGEGRNQPVDIEALKAEYLELSSYNVNIALFNRFFEANPEAAAWLLAKAQSAALPYNANGQAVMYMDQAGVLSQNLAQMAEDAGAQFFYNTAGIQLVQDADGGVTGVVGQSQEGGYVQLNAAKGVVLATGCYGANAQLKTRWCPATLHFDNYQVGDNNNGDGHMMGIWAGACMQQWPHSKKVDPHLSVTDGGLRWNNWNTPYLAVNDRGERFMKEDCPGTYRPNGTYDCPESHVNLVFDSVTDYGDQEELDNLIDMGFAFKGETLDELGAAMGLDASAISTLAATVSRYNSLCDSGKDTDFFKDAEYLIPVQVGPFFAVRIEYMIGALLGGLSVNADCNVVDTNMQPIAGLYAVGNTMGGLQGSTDYQWHDFGFSLGAASTFGYYVGKMLANA